MSQLAPELRRIPALSLEERLSAYAELKSSPLGPTRSLASVTMSVKAVELRIVLWTFVPVLIALVEEDPSFRKSGSVVTVLRKLGLPVWFAVPEAEPSPVSWLLSVTLVLATLL